MVLCQCGSAFRMKLHIVCGERNKNHTITLFSQEELFELARFFSTVPNFTNNYSCIIVIDAIDGVVCWKYTLIAV